MSAMEDSGASAREGDRSTRDVREPTILSDCNPFGVAGATGTGRGERSSAAPDKLE